MSQHLINQYLNQLAKIKQVSGVSRESVIREAFKDLLKAWGRSLNLTFIPEYEVSAAKVRNYVDGALLHDLRIPFGYWEAKDEADDLDAEIAKKLGRGYPQTNIIFEDSRTAVLIQNKIETSRVPMEHVGRLKNLLDQFFGYERAEIADFRKAIAQFKVDLPDVLKALRARIDDAYTANSSFATTARDFLKQAQESINPAITDADIREMLIQHILTEDIFARVFGQSDFHRENNVAKALYALEGKFFKGDIKQQTLKALEPYYAAIRSTAALISSHSEKQGFLKAIYENFYKVYDPKKADRLGVVYTPNEIVRFMVESADWLCEKHFGKSLIDKNVEILDPATGTGTFIVELLEHFRGQPSKLKYKYAEELHANEVAILPYYVANLNIEATYAAITGEYREFKNLCFVDTLDNTAALKTLIGQHHGDLIGGMSTENIDRIKRQNERKISVIIGNPPYNANQQNENNNNKNRAYPEIDKRVKLTYIKKSRATKTALYDMYARFFRWASDRLEENGILAFISNRSFIDSFTFDGFRSVLASEFNSIWIMDLGGDVRANPKLSGTKHNVFGIQTGVAVSFLVKTAVESSFTLKYARRPEFETFEEKLSFLNGTDISRIFFEKLVPDKANNWINVTQDNFADYLPVVHKNAKTIRNPNSIFQAYSTGLMTGRDDWVYDFSKQKLKLKIDFFRSRFLSVGKYETHEKLAKDIKWSRNLIRKIGKPNSTKLANISLRAIQFRPFVEKVFVDSEIFLDEIGALKSAFAKKNLAITFLGVSSSNQLAAFAVNKPFDYGLLKQGNGGTQALYRYRYSTSGLQADNITDWALDQFKAQYGASSPTTKDHIFAYVYAVLYDPIYRETYALNLKREFPRIPFYTDFSIWRKWGQKLLDLHISYETVDPFPLERTDTPDKKSKATPRPILRADRNAGIIMLDTETQLSGVPLAAWEYKLGNRSAIDWVLDQHKEKTPKDPTVREKFNTYRFADYKESVIELLKRVTTVSIETVKITEAMRKLPRT